MLKVTDAVYPFNMVLTLNFCMLKVTDAKLSFIKVKIAVCKFKIFAVFPICFVMKMPAYKPEANKLVRVFWLKNELFQFQVIWTCSKCP